MEDKVLGPEFWAEIKEKSPKAHAAFLLWIDQYKTAVGWTGLFNSLTLKQNGVFVFQTILPKFHDLPGFMQLGIILKFAKEYIDDESIPISYSPDTEIEYIFIDIENRFTK